MTSQQAGLKPAYELAAQLGAILANKQWIITSAESCTGGGVAYALTDTPGSSAYFQQSIVTYSNEAKMRYLNVSAKTLEQFGAVSEQTVQEMALGAQQAASADISVVTSGIAGPDGGSDEKPVGLVWFAVQFKQQTFSEKQVFKGSRAQVREQATAHALALVLKMIESA